MNKWAKNSYQNYPQAQEVCYEDELAFKAAFKELSSLPPLIFAAEAKKLEEKLALVCKGEAFLLQGGDCAESFKNFSATTIRDNLKLLLQMSIILSFESSKPVIKLGRFAGQFAKPRSKLSESLGEETLLAYRGDIINDIKFTKKARTPDPKRMLKAYYQSAATLNLIRAFIAGGLADIHKINNLNLHFVQKSKSLKFQKICAKITKSLGFLKALNQEIKPNTSIFTSHEALLLPYEEALTRIDSMSSLVYDCSAHMLWLGDRTKDYRQAHAHFLSGVANPLGVKIGPDTKLDPLLKLIDLLNPQDKPGRLSLIFRLGHKEIKKTLPSLLKALKDRQIVFICDPMHANTSLIKGQKSRDFKHILSESLSFFTLCKEAGVYPGGVHLEMSAQRVNECKGGLIKRAYKEGFQSLCDPRLNADQALEYAFKIAPLI